MGTTTMKRTAKIVESDIQAKIAGTLPEILRFNERLKDLKTQVPKDFPLEKRLIWNLFANTTGDSFEEAKMRLTVIDAMYSTQVNANRHYGLDDVAHSILRLQAKRPVKEIFATFAENPDRLDELFGRDGKNIWNDSFGIGKNGMAKGKAMSLVSKYAYFETGCRFPIFDSIARQMLHALWRFFVTQEKPPTKRSLDSVGCFVRCVNRLKDEISRKTGIGVDYETLDCLMWFVGKLLRGNFAPILPKDDYVACATAKGNGADKDIHARLKRLAAILDKKAGKNDYTHLLRGFCQLALDLVENGVRITG